MEHLINEENSLVKYASPVMVIDPYGHEIEVQMPGEVRSKIFQGKKTEKESLEMQNLLNDIFPPREWEENSAVWQQQVSAEPVSRTEVLRLRETLDLWLKQRQARATGICAIRRDVYAQLFDEMIRQETVLCPERGMLLLRMRDEFRMSLASFKALYESSIDYAIKKSVQAEESVISLELEVNEARKEHEEVLQEVEDIQSALDLSVKRGKEYVNVSNRKHEEEMEFLAITNAQLKSQLDSIYLSKK